MAGPLHCLFYLLDKMKGKSLKMNNIQIKLFGDSVTDEHLSVKGKKLPNTKQILMSFSFGEKSGWIVLSNPRLVLRLKY